MGNMEFFDISTNIHNQNTLHTSLFRRANYPG